MELRDALLICCSVMLLVVSILLISSQIKQYYLDKEVDICTNMMFQNAEYQQHLNERLYECRETIDDYRAMVKRCTESEKQYYRFYDDMPRIVPIEPFTIENFTLDTSPYLKRINMTPGIVLLKGGCNHSDPFSPCL